MFTPEKFIQIQISALTTCQSVAERSIDSLEKFSELNAQTARSSLEETLETFKTGLGVRDIKHFAGFSYTGMGQPVLEKAAHYTSSALHIAGEAAAAVNKIIEQKICERNQDLYSNIESLSRNAPAGTEGVITILKQATTAVNGAYDQFSRAIKQAAEIAEAQFSASNKTSSSNRKKNA